jgi:prepilin-type N-terminal cleavage/methylation domain-containing protein
LDHNYKNGGVMNNQEGFTLIEILVIILILSILSAILIPRLTDITHSASKAVDKTKLHNLNLATSIYRSEKRTEGTDIFEGISTNLLRMNKLVNEGYLDEILIPRLIEHEFVWDITDQVWEIEVND